MRPKSELSELVDSVWDEVGIVQNMCETGNSQDLHFQTILGSQLCLEDIKVMKYTILRWNLKHQMSNLLFQQMLDNVGINLPNYKLRSLTEDLTSSRGDHSNGLTKPEFERLCQKLTQEDVRRTFKTSKQHDR